MKLNEIGSAYLHNSIMSNRNQNTRKRELKFVGYIRTNSYRRSVSFKENL